MNRVRTRGRSSFLALLAGVLVLAAGCGGQTKQDGAALSGPPEAAESDAVSNWAAAQQGTDAGVTWRTLIGDSARGDRCISVDLDPKPSPPVLPSGSGPVDATGRPIPLPPVATPDPGTHHTDGCAPAPSLTDGSSQPLYTLKAHQPDGQPGRYSYAAGTAAPEIEQITIEFSDGTTAPAVVGGGTFIVIYPSSKKLASLRPAVPNFPKLHCSVTSATIPSLAGGPPSFTVYGDGGCSGYTF